MFQRHEQIAGQPGGTAALSLAQAVPLTQAIPGTGPLSGRFGRRSDAAASAWRDRLADIDWVPDLGADIGSRTWWRGLATLALLCGSVIATAPGIRPITGVATPAMSPSDYDEARALAIAPIAFGSDSGKHMAATDAVQPLAQAPERPQIELTATMGAGDSFTRVLERAGVGGVEARRVAAQVAAAVPLGDIGAGTRIDLVLGRRPARTEPRPVDALSMRARFDLRIEMERINGALTLRRIPIAVDTTPLRVRGRVGDSLYASARAAGAPADAIQSYLRILGGQLSVGRDIRADDEYDIIIDHRRAETGETETGKLLYVGLIRGGKPKVQMIEWQVGGRSQWYEASGVGQQRGGMARPTSGRVTSTFGMRRHPILGYARMHSGMDFGGGYGAPIYAVTDGTVIMAGRNGGYGNFVKLSHGGGMASGYGHMSRIAVANGQRVRRGQVIGYIGSTGLSTGPHLHYELYRNGRAVNPSSVTFVSRAVLEGAALANFRARIRSLTSVAPGAALAPMAARTFEAPKAASLAAAVEQREANP